MKCPNCGNEKSFWIVSSSEDYDEYKCPKCGNIFKVKK